MIIGSRCVAILILSLLAAGAVNPSAGLRKYSAVEIQIENKRNERGQKLPEDSVPELKDQLAGAIVALHQFERVDEYVDTKATPSSSPHTMILKVRIAGYTGAQNNAGVKAVVRVVDKESGKDVLEEAVNAQLRYDSGALSAALRKLARSTADLLKRNL